jgi:AraC family transcriptional regulator
MVLEVAHAFERFAPFGDGRRCQDRCGGWTFMKQVENLRDRRRVLNVLTYAWRRLEAPIDSQDLATQAGLSPTHFHRVFLEVTDETPQAHLRRLRLERAALALRFGDADVAGVAVAAGYDSREGFTRAFAGQFGESPAVYRDRARRYVARVASQSRVRQAAIPVSLGSFPAIRVAYWRHYGPYRGVGRACIELGRWAKPRGLLAPDASFLGISYDDQWVTPARHCRYDACLTVPADFAGDGLIGVQEVPGGMYAVGQYEGRLLGLFDAWKWLIFCWYPASGYRAWGPWAFDVHPASILPTSRMELLALSVRHIRCRLYLAVSRNAAPGFLY